MSRGADDGIDIDDLDHIEAKRTVTVLNEGVRIPTHALRAFEDQGISEDRFFEIVEELQQRLTGYLDADETLESVYRGVGSSFNGAGGGVYVFGATDRRFVLLDTDDNFEEVQYDSVTEVDSEQDYLSFKMTVYDPPNWKRRMGIMAAILLGVWVWGSFIGTSGLVGLVGIVAFFGLLYYPVGLVLAELMETGRWYTNETIRMYHEKIMIRTPTSAETTTTVDASVDHYLETADVTVSESTSERFVLRQWLTPEEVAGQPGELGGIRKMDNGMPIREYDPVSTQYGAVETFGSDTAEEPDLTVLLSKFVRKHR
jgi:hypothetical protein